MITAFLVFAISAVLVLLFVEAAKAAFELYDYLTSTFENYQCVVAATPSTAHNGSQTGIFSAFDFRTYVIYAFIAAAACYYLGIFEGQPDVSEHENTTPGSFPTTPKTPATSVASIIEKEDSIVAEPLQPPHLHFEHLPRDQGSILTENRDVAFPDPAPIVSGLTNLNLTKKRHPGVFTVPEDPDDEESDFEPTDSGHPHPGVFRVPDDSDFDSDFDDKEEGDLVHSPVEEVQASKGLNSPVVLPTSTSKENKEDEIVYLPPISGVREAYYGPSWKAALNKGKEDNRRYWELRPAQRAKSTSIERSYKSFQSRKDRDLPVRKPLSPRKHVPQEVANGDKKSDIIPKKELGMGKRMHTSILQRLDRLPTPGSLLPRIETHIETKPMVDQRVDSPQDPIEVEAGGSNAQIKIKPMVDHRMNTFGDPIGLETGGSKTHIETDAMVDERMDPSEDSTGIEACGNNEHMLFEEAVAESEEKCSDPARPEPMHQIAFAQTNIPFSFGYIPGSNVPQSAPNFALESVNTSNVVQDGNPFAFLSTSTFNFGSNSTQSNITTHQNHNALASAESQNVPTTQPINDVEMGDDIPQPSATEINEVESNNLSRILPDNDAQEFARRRNVAKFRPEEERETSASKSETANQSKSLYTLVQELEMLFDNDSAKNSQITALSWQIVDRINGVWNMFPSEKADMEKCKPKFFKILDRFVRDLEKLLAKSFDFWDASKPLREEEAYGKCLIMYWMLRLCDPRPENNLQRGFSKLLENLSQDYEFWESEENADPAWEHNNAWLEKLEFLFESMLRRDSSEQIAHLSRLWDENTKGLKKYVRAVGQAYFETFDEPWEDYCDAIEDPVEHLGYDEDLYGAHCKIANWMGVMQQDWTSPQNW